MKTRIFAIALTGALFFGCSTPSLPVATFVEPEDPVAVSAEVAAQWDAVGKKLNAAWGDSDFRYSRSAVPADVYKGTCKLTAWKGEKVSAQFLLWSNEAKPGVACKMEDLKSKGAVIPATAAEINFVRYTLADDTTPKFMETGRYRKKEAVPVIAPDMLDSLSTFDMAPRQTRPVWVTISVPADAQEGVYKTDIIVTSNDLGKVILPLELEVVNHTLAAPCEWDYHLDLWQHPSSVAYAQGLEMWSDEHFEAMKPVMKRLADAGQKVITATLNKDPWNHQCYYAYEPMIKWTKHKNGSWSFDYNVFDRWVQFMLDLGIDREINCYSMVPWNCELEYFDETKGEVITVKAEPGKSIFPKIWKPFLVDFKKHLEQKGWLEFTNIAMDERSPEAMQAAADVLTDCAPEMGFALADNHRSYQKFTMMRDICVAIHHNRVSKEDIESRRAKDHYTTFYVCCRPSYPNTFTTSNPYEAELLGWYNIACDYDGMLRWAYNSWAENPQYDSRFGNWMCGDTYFVYPYNRSSIRFDKLIDGIEVAEKIRQLRREGVDTTPVDKVLEKIYNTQITDYTQPWHEIIVEARAALDEVSRK